MSCPMGTLSLCGTLCVCFLISMDHSHPLFKPLQAAGKWALPAWKDGQMGGDVKRKGARVMS